MYYVLKTIRSFVELIRCFKSWKKNYSINQQITYLITVTKNLIQISLELLKIITPQSKYRVIDRLINNYNSK